MDLKTYFCIAGLHFALKYSDRSVYIKTGPSKIKPIIQGLLREGVITPAASLSNSPIWPILKLGALVQDGHKLPSDF